MKSKKKKQDQQEPVLWTEKTGEELWEALQNGPYDEEDTGKSFVIISAGRLSNKQNRTKKNLQSD